MSDRNYDDDLVAVATVLSALYARASPGKAVWEQGFG